MKIENKIREELIQQSQQYTLPTDMKNRISARIREEENGRSIQMFKFNKKKMVLLVACIVLVVGCVSYAGGKVVSHISQGYGIPDYTKYEDIAKAEKEAGITSYAPQGFQNGYVFSGIYVSSNIEEDENGNTMDKYQSMEVDYRKDDKRVMFMVSPRPVPEQDKAAYETMKVCGNKAYYLELNNKFVPEDYEATEEEKELMEAGKLNIGYGADEISTSMSRSLIIEKDGCSYNLFTIDQDLNLTKENLLDMANQIFGKQ